MERAQETGGDRVTSNSLKNRHFYFAYGFHALNGREHSVGPRKGGNNPNQTNRLGT